MFWTGLQCWNEAPRESLCCTERSGHILERETVGVSVFVASVDAERNSKKKKKKKCAAKTANTLISLFAQGAVKLFPLGYLASHQG